ncbi:MAG TPA: guanylate kinase [Candidatus Bathyarchaeia archaeon]|nr:guanylate kinase [Candidatus Bathyarchaeia archaeon]
MKKRFNRGRLIILSGPSGSGKTSIHEILLADKRLKGKVVRSVSMTTRSARSGERHGRDYFFVSHKMFEYKIRTGQMLEWAKVFASYYGTPAKPVRELLNQGKHVLLCIDVQGAKQVMKTFPDAISIFIKAPSLRELERRLKNRASEGPKERRVRLKIAKKELEQARYYQSVIVNDKLPIACRDAAQEILKRIKN